MKLNYNLDIGAGSSNIDHTPSLSARRLPLFTTAAGHFVANPGYFTEREGLENNYLLIYTLAGRGMLRYKGGEYVLLPGTAVLIDCFVYQYYGTASEEPWEFKWAHLGGISAGEYEERVNGGALNVVALDDACRTGPALDSIRGLLLDSRSSLADVKICGALMEILTELITSRQHASAPRGLHRADVEAALEYIRANYSRAVAVDEIIGRTHMSKFYFLRLFKSYTGLGLYEYLNNHRIDMAKRLLKSTDGTVGSVAQAVGFNDVNCFIRYFKKVTGVTPATFRKYYLY